MKTIKLNEKSYNVLKNSIINEISYGTVSNARDRAYDLFWDVRVAFDDFYTTLKDAMYKAKYEGGNGSENPYLEKIKELSEPIYDILIKKNNQEDTFFNASTGSVSHEKFYDSPDAEENNIEDMDLNYLQKSYPK